MALVLGRGGLVLRVVLLVVAGLSVVVVVGLRVVVLILRVVVLGRRVVVVVVVILSVLPELGNTNKRLRSNRRAKQDTQHETRSKSQFYLSCSRQVASQ